MLRIPEIVPATQDEVSFGEKRRADLAESAVAAAAFQAILVPVQLQRLQEVPKNQVLCLATGNR